MSDWAALSIESFDELAGGDRSAGLLVGEIVLDRLPFCFANKQTYFNWRSQLAEGIDVDPRDVILVGSAATGRSLSRKKNFKQFDSSSDIDVAVISARHFDEAWAWLRNTNPQILGLDSKGQEDFAAHRSHLVFDGVIAADSFLSYFPYGSQWLRELQRSAAALPAVMRGRATSVRLYRDSASLRASLTRVMRDYREYLGKSDPIEGVAVDDRA